MNLVQHVNKLDYLILEKTAPISEVRGRIASIREYAEAQAKEIANLKKENKKLVATNKEIISKYEKLTAKHQKLQQSQRKPTFPPKKPWIIRPD